MHFRKSLYQEKIAKMKQKIVLFIEPVKEPSVTPVKIGNLFMNRFSIEEDTNFEILKVFYPKMNLEKFYFDKLTEEGLGLNISLSKYCKMNLL